MRDSTDAESGSRAIAFEARATRRWPAAASLPSAFTTSRSRSSGAETPSLPPIAAPPRLRTFRRVDSRRRARRPDLRGHRPIPAMRHEVPIGCPIRSSTSSATARGTPSRPRSRSTASRRSPAARRRMRRGVRVRRADRAGPAARGGRPRGRRQCVQGARGREGRRAADVPDRVRRAALAVRNPGHERPRDLRRPATGEERGGTRWDPARAARGRGRDGRALAICCGAAEPNGSGLVVDGEPLTAERIKDAIDAAFMAHGVVADDFIVSHGAQGAVGHDMGSGPIAAGRDGRDRPLAEGHRDGCYADMTRTYVVGEPPEEIVRVPHARQGGARPRRSRRSARGSPARSVFRLVCELFHEAG